ncbi:DUF3489 domain-containing protein [Castellaniella sp.]|uniref:DUF3489 domain-containing protein n=1 Tax=Castellaniella sp. TaxID=1955812 RepID=UPI003A90E240
MTTLTPTQQTILDRAINNTQGRIEWFPDTIKGGARQKVLKALAKRDAIKEVDGTWRMTEAGYALMGVGPKGATPPVEDAPDLDATVTALETSFAKPRTRENSKQAEVIRMLQRPEGATIAQIMEVTGWQAHTVRGTLAGAFKKKLGLTITSDKEQGGERVYRSA